MYGFIYLTTNLINNRKYIGKKKYCEGWENYLGSGIALRNAVKRYGRENFKMEVIAEAPDKETLNKLEKEYIKKYNATQNPQFYNIASGGDGGWTIEGYTEEQMKNYSNKMSEALKGRTSPTKGMAQSKETIEKRVSKIRGKKLSKEARKNISISHSHYWKGKKLTEEHRKKISENNARIWKGKQLPIEVRQKISESVKAVTFNKICERCNHEFIGKTTTIKICYDCRTREEEEMKKKLTKICKVCGKEFSTFGRKPWNRKTCWECNP